MAHFSNPAQFVQWFREAAPYVHAFGGRTFVVGFSGEVVASRAFSKLVHDFNLLAALGIRLVLVHGARPQIEAELKARGLRSRYAKGLRITDAAALTCVKHAAGALRVDIEALLSQGLPNSPMAGSQIRVASGNFITAQPIGVRKGIDFQFAGSVRKVDAVAIARRLDAEEVVLISHIGYSPTGEVFNLAWEGVAESVAVALKADKLLMLTDHLPTDRRGNVLHEQTARSAQALLAKGGLSTETKRTLERALRALAAGVGRVHLVSRLTDGATLLELFTHAGVGTMITADAVEKLRTARIEDVGGILGLIAPLEADGTLVKRSREVFEREIENFRVIDHDGLIAGCAALYPYPEEKTAEFACLAVAAEYRGADYGERLLEACEERARELRLKRVFVLTTSAVHWFRLHGFAPATVAALPARRQSLYNYQRNSKVLVKKL